MTGRFLAAVAALVFAGSGWAGQEALKWSELGPRVSGKKVALVLPDGTRVQGKVRGVDAAGLRMDISKTSDKKAQPKGAHTIARQSVSFVQVTEYRKMGRLLVTLGALVAAGTVAAIWSSDSGITEGTMVVAIPAVAAAGTAGIGVGGYYVGKAVDKRVTEIRILPGD